MDCLIITDPALAHTTNMSKVVVGINVGKDIVDIILEGMLQVDAYSIADSNTVVDANDNKENNYYNTTELISRINACSAKEIALC